MKTKDMLKRISEISEEIGSLEIHLAEIGLESVMHDALDGIDELRNQLETKVRADALINGGE